MIIFKNANANRWAAIQIAIALLFTIGAAPAVSAADVQSAAQTTVRTIDWASFRPSDDPDVARMRQILLTSLRYNVPWLDKQYPATADGRSCVVTLPESGRKHEHIIRPAAVVAYGIAVALKTGDFDESTVGKSRDECLSAARRTIHGIAASHTTNVDNSTYGAAKKTPAWGDHWQSAHWSANLTFAAWLIWKDLDDETQQLILRMVEHEASRFIKPGYKPHIWATRDKILTPGNTGAEENAWDSTILQAAVAMMPHHPNAPRWKETASFLMVQAFATRKDMDDTKTMVDGRPVAEWLQGYNVRDDGAVINHGIVHPDYCLCFTLSTRAYLFQSLAKEPVPEAADFNAARMYYMLAEKQWSSPPHKAPGGTILTPGKADIYYPEGTDWSHYRYLNYCLVDAIAYTLGWDHGRPYSARDWMHLRMDKAIEMQSRHADGHTFAKGEYDTYPGAEQSIASTSADGVLYLWLHAQHAIQPKANWISNSSRQ
jgi:hypothetical protein